MAEAPAWQVRPLEIMHLVALFDSLRVKIREDAMARDKAVCSTFWIRGL
ncbi:transposase-like protein [Kerstersia gyiorum]|nr:transposase-like protein [Kerstersia gyiorum]MCP1638221.1 transposase-like protein [Kerstersia gyiorum]MCP1671767.1 transposase-like protein [Kerstersia gyiorum]MCP1679284.1 transposase-like protein [Kerstersia gyiorum]MCP1682956.1 transposase-like protein [Kerstersia gyiorum]